MNRTDDLTRILEGHHDKPCDYLGMHVQDGAIQVRTFQPQAISVDVVETDGKRRRFPMDKIAPAGLFEADISREGNVFPYEFEIQYKDAGMQRLRDPYAFHGILSDFDMHLFGEGTHIHIYDRLGAHPMENDGVQGICFATWAPNARRISVVGDFNGWDGKCHAMCRQDSSPGIWELFIPGLEVGTLYKFEILGHDGQIIQRYDPYAFYSEARPKTACIVWDVDQYVWQDEDYMARRRERDFLHAPMSVYEMHLGSWMRGEDNRFLTYREMAEPLARHIKGMGFTHIELMPVSEHPLDESWGYQVVGQYAPTSRYGTPDDFKAFIDHMHQNDIGVIIDWVPGHFPRDGFALRRFDGTALYEHEDPRQGEHKEWGTMVFNFGRNEVRNFLISSAMFWLEKYHIDGLRVDAVASMLYLDYNRKEGEWVANQYGGNENLEAIDFLKRLNELVHERYPGALTVAEESTSFGGVSRPTYLGGLGFSMKWNMGWMHDILGFFSKDPIFRKYEHNALTFALLYAYHENFVLALSHDEVVYGKRSLLNRMPGDIWQKFANLRLLYGYMFAQPGKKHLFMGAEFGQWDEWNCQKGLDWHLADYRPHWSVERYLSRLNYLHQTEPAFYELDFEWQGFEWIDFHDTDSGIVSFIRRARNPEDHIVCVFNTTPVERTDYRIGVPEHVYYEEILNSDSELYWGSNLGNEGGRMAEEIPCHGKPFSIRMVMPPLGAVYLKPKR